MTSVLQNVEGVLQQQMLTKHRSSHRKHHLSISEGSADRDQMLEPTLNAWKLIKLFYGWTWNKHVWESEA